MAFPWINVIVNTFVAAGTLGLACFAAWSIWLTRRVMKEDRDYRLVDKAPILAVTLEYLRLDPDTESIEWLTLGIKNVGSGPAFNIVIECSQNNSVFHFACEEGIPRFHLAPGEVDKWEFENPRPSPKDQTGERDLVIETSCQSMFDRTTEQVFVCSAYQGRVESDAPPDLRSVRLQTQNSWISWGGWPD
ncbi:hypothetical protein E3J62_07585 [candidate division TA06 bacterium]|uniref:Uncharacterized protein n=1 Tax=candidate division TA06 bacterium TaxID=2250710 RepID=A0A523USN7_UNCT6|nr:MAG: hypothetical protein E3J62_07585 [candidate division TA06 bacterium]